MLSFTQESLHKLYLNLFMLSLKIENITPTDTASHNPHCPGRTALSLLLLQGQLQPFDVILLISSGKDSSELSEKIKMRSYLEAL